MAERGPGTVKIELTEAGRAVFGGHAEPIKVAFAGGPIFRGPSATISRPSSPWRTTAPSW